MSDLTSKRPGGNAALEAGFPGQQAGAPRPVLQPPDMAASGSNPASRLPAVLRPYSRITSSGAFIPEIDGLRFIAIFSVYIYHLAGDILHHCPPGHICADSGNWLFAVTQILNVGVPLFFVISGFILGLPFALALMGAGRKISLRKYFLRRVTRLEPPYILSLLLFFALKVVAARGTAAKLLPDLVASLFYLHNAVYGAPSVINFVAWSLEVEVQFYLLAPLLALVFAIRRTSVRRAVLVGMLLLSTAISRLCPHEGAMAHSLLAFGQYFLAGFLLVEFYLGTDRNKNPNWLWDLAWLAGWASFLVLLVQGGVTVAWVAPWLILLLYIAGFQGVAARRLITNPWITTIGGMCYSIYLLHNYLVAGFGMVTERVLPSSPFAARLFLQFLLMSPAVLVISALYFRWIERPCMRPDWPQRLLAECRRLKARWLFAPAVAASLVESSEDQGRFRK